LHDGQPEQSRGQDPERAGFKDIYQLRGGYRAWKDAGLPVEK
jgi:hypothetical protein